MFVWLAEPRPTCIGMQGPAETSSVLMSGLVRFCLLFLSVWLYFGKFPLKVFPVCSLNGPALFPVSLQQFGSNQCVSPSLWFELCVFSFCPSVQHLYARMWWCLSALLISFDPKLSRVKKSKLQHIDFSENCFSNCPDRLKTFCFLSRPP